MATDFHKVSFGISSEYLKSKNCVFKSIPVLNLFLFQWNIWSAFSMCCYVLHLLYIYNDRVLSPKMVNNLWKTSRYNVAIQKSDTEMNKRITYRIDHASVKMNEI